MRAGPFKTYQTNPSSQPSRLAEACNTTPGSSLNLSVYLLKYLCKGAGSTMTAADEKYDDDVEMLDAFDHEELISMLADVVQGVDVD